MLWKSLILAVVTTSFVAQRPPAQGALLPTTVPSTFEVEGQIRLCEFITLGEQCHLEPLDPIFIASGRLLLLARSRRFPWGYVGYAVIVRYERSPTGIFLADVIAKPFSRGDPVTLRGRGHDPRTALIAALDSTRITPKEHGP